MLSSFTLWFHDLNNGISVLLSMCTILIPLGTRVYKDNSMSSLPMGKTKPIQKGHGQKNQLCWEIEGSFTVEVILVFQLEEKRNVCLIYKEPNMFGKM